jgi:Chloramphenicol 3-O-phosphotransferase
MENGKCMKKGKVIFLNGVSSSGKTTLAWKIQDIATEPYYLISQDQFCETWPYHYWKANPEQIFNHTMHLMYQTIKMFAELGENLIVDHVLLNNEKLKSANNEGTLSDIKEQLSNLDVLYVHVTCPPEILRKREIDRGDRKIGNAESQLPYLDPQTGYDITVDTYKMTVDECAQDILSLVKP